MQIQFKLVNHTQHTQKCGDEERTVHTVVFAPVTSDAVPGAILEIHSLPDCPWQIGKIYSVDVGALPLAS